MKNGFAAACVSLILALSPCPVRSAAAPDAASVDLEIPNRVPQGGLIRGRLPVGSQLALLPPAPSGSEPQAATEAGLAVRVAGDGWFVIGVGRDASGQVRLAVTLPDKSQKLVAIAIVPREWQIERIDGVPESTVNPPPELAARIEREQAEVSRARERDDDRSDFEASFTWPIHGRVSGVYGSQRIYNGTPKSPHSGLDVAAAKGTPVRAPAGGIITFANPDLYLTGGTVLVDHGHGLSSSFLHLSRIDVHVGERVEQGQVIGLVGATGRATGPHMHWGLNWFGVRVDPQLLLEPATAPARP